MLVNNYTNNEQYGNGIVFKALPTKYREVDNYLIRGPYPKIRDVFKLKKEGVTQIYDFRHYGFRGFKWVERLACKLAGVEYKRKPFSFLEGLYPNLNDYETVAKSVKENGEKGGKTLFHCNSGTHRTSLMSAFYKITKGNSLSSCKSNPNFQDTVEKTVKEEIDECNYFSRNRVRTDVKNPVVRIINIFNNNVQTVTQKAFNMFMDMMKQ